MYMGVLLECMSVCHLHAMPTEAGIGHQTPGARVTDGCKTARGFRKLNPSLLQQQPVLLSTKTAAVPSLLFKGFFSDTCVINKVMMSNFPHSIAYSYSGTQLKEFHYSGAGQKSLLIIL